MTRNLNQLNSSVKMPQNITLMKYRAFLSTAKLEKSYSRL
jgi:hypothetical protein